MTELTFLHLNETWNAEPNAPCPRIQATGALVSVTFFLNPCAYSAAEGEKAELVFEGCSRWRVDPTNDEAWYSGRGRYSGAAPQWGEFFEIEGHDLSEDDLEWNITNEDPEAQRHFIFYFRDETFECYAQDWSLKRAGSEQRAS